MCGFRIAVVLITSAFSTPLRYRVSNSATYHNTDLPGINLKLCWDVRAKFNLLFFIFWVAYPFNQSWATLFLERMQCAREITVITVGGQQQLSHELNTCFLSTRSYSEANGSYENLVYLIFWLIKFIAVLFLAELEKKTCTTHYYG